MVRKIVFLTLEKKIAQEQKSANMGGGDFYYIIIDKPHSPSLSNFTKAILTSKHIFDFRLGI